MIDLPPPPAIVRPAEAAASPRVDRGLAAVQPRGNRGAAVPRGIRLNNPGNIRHGEKWRGLARMQGDPSFCRFDTPEAGLRAMARTIANYSRHHGIYSIDGIVRRWAPPKDGNPTEVYIAYVARRTGLPARAPLRLTNAPALERILPAMIEFEQGQCPYPPEMIRAAIEEATK